MKPAKINLILSIAFANDFPLLNSEFDDNNIFALLLVTTDISKV